MPPKPPLDMTTMTSPAAADSRMNETIISTVVAMGTWQGHLVLDHETPLRRGLLAMLADARAALAATPPPDAAERGFLRSLEIALEGVEQEAAVGARTVFDVLDAEQELFEARVTLVREQASEVVFAFELLQVVGSMVASELGLPTELYDPTLYYDQVRGKWIGFGEDYSGTNPLNFESDLRDVGDE